MPNNLTANVPFAGVAKSSISFASAGLNTTNIWIVFEVGSPLKSWDPSRSINSVTDFTADRGYYIVPKVGMDLSAILAPPLAGGGAVTLNTPTGFAVTGSTGTTITMGWTDNNSSPNEDQFEIEVATLSDKSDAAYLNNPAQNAVTSTHSGLAGGVTRYYRIRAKGNGTTTLDSPFSAWATGATTGSGITRRTFAGYLSRWEVPADPADTTKIQVRTVGSDKYVIRLKDDKHALSTVYDLLQAGDDAAQPKHLVSGIDTRPAMQFIPANFMQTGNYPGTDGIDFPTEQGIIFRLPNFPASSVHYFFGSPSAGAAFNFEVNSTGRLFIYAGGTDVDTGINLAVNTTYHLVKRREADGTTKVWLNNTLSFTGAVGTHNSLYGVRLGDSSSLGIDMLVAEVWVSGSDNGAAAVLPTDAERTALYNDAKTEFTTLP